MRHNLQIHASLSYLIIPLHAANKTADFSPRYFTGSTLWAGECLIHSLSMACRTQLSSTASKPPVQQGEKGMQRNRSGETTRRMIARSHFMSQSRSSRVWSDSLLWFVALSVPFGRGEGSESSVLRAGSLRDANGLELCRLM